MSTASPFPFIVGSPRSGTTLLRLMLNAHPELAVPPESYFIIELRPWVKRYIHNDAFDLGLFGSDLATSPNFPQVRRNWGLDASLIQERLTGTHRIDFAEAIRRIYLLYAEVHGKVRYGDKTPWYVLHMRYLGRIFPEARFVHLIRDVRDVAPSLTRQEWGPGDMLEAAAIWRHLVGTGRRLGRLLGSDRYLEVRYEDLVADPRATLVAICDFLALDYHEDMLGYHRHALEAIPAHARGLDEHLTRPPIIGLRDWHRDLDPDAISLCQAAVSPLLEQLGYPIQQDTIPYGSRMLIRARALLWEASYRARRAGHGMRRSKFKLVRRSRRVGTRLARRARRLARKVRRLGRRLKP